MVSKRQLLARKKFKEEHPDLFPTPEPTPKDPNKRKKPKFKRGKSDKLKGPRNPDDKPRKSSFRKHPLRVPGLKPGEACFICKAQDHIAKNCPEKAQWEKNKICLSCRRRGHSLKNCPNKPDEAVDIKLCYNCGQTGHSLFKCPQPLQDGGTKYASCFICKEHGHLSKNCPKNTHGIYPKGGCCKICGGVTHLARDCPNKGSNVSHAHKGEAAERRDLPRGRVTKFVSGDELEDDFMAEGNDADSNKKKADPASQSSDSNVKSKKKQEGPKVVNFGC